MTPRRTRTATVALALGTLTACGSSDDEGTQGSGAGGGGGVSNAGGSVGMGGTPAQGGSPGSGGGASGGGPTGLEQVCATAGGTRLAQGPCYKGCTFNGTLEPLYDQNGDCGRLGYKCGTDGYCIPNLKCAVDTACQALGGPGWSCITTVGPFVGQCMLSCAGNADCPASGRSTPYSCKPIDSVGVCRF